MLSSSSRPDEGQGGLAAAAEAPPPSSSEMDPVFDDEETGRATSLGSSSSLGLRRRSMQEEEAIAGEGKEDPPGRSARHSYRKQQRRIERMSSILSASYVLIDSRAQERQEQQQQQQQQQQLSLVEQEPRQEPSSRLSRATTISIRQEPQQQQHHQHEPFIKSLTKSLRLVEKKSQNWWANHHQHHHHAGFHLLQPSTRVLILTILHLAAYSVLGQLLRIFIGQLFGGACPAYTFASTAIDDDGYGSGGDIPQWLANVSRRANLCLASNAGGAVFADLPANLLGSFFMGAWQASGDLGLTHGVPMAAWSANHYFQDWTLHHLGLRTGFCGSLTTLASWNSQMVRLMDGSHVHGGSNTSGDDGDGSQFFTAMMGYLLGLQAALTCFRWGQDVAIWKYRAAQPSWAKEEDLLAFAFSKENPNVEDGDEDHTKLTKTPLTDHERRFLSVLVLQQEHQVANQNMSALGDLERWKISTDKHRLGQGGGGGDNDDDENENALLILHEVERQVLTEENFSLPEEWKSVADDNGWDLAALQRFAQKAQQGGTGQSARLSNKKENLTAQQHLIRGIAASLPFIMSLSFVLLFVVLDYVDIDRWYYRKLWASSLLAPLGTLLRWKLSSWNGRRQGTAWMWFPLGTFAANLIACLVSVTLTGVEDSRSLAPGTAVLVYAVKTGWAACTSTVSSYVAEGTVLQNSYPHHAKGYHYMFGTLLLAGGLGLVVYSPIVRT